MFVSGSQAAVEGTVVRTTLPGTDGLGVGIIVQNCHTGCSTPASATIEGSLIERNLDHGIIAVHADVSIENTVVRETFPHAHDASAGRGLVAACLAPGCSKSTRVVNSLFDENHDVGVLVSGPSATLDGVVARSTWPAASDGMRGRGISIGPFCAEAGCFPGASIATIQRTLVDRNHEVGILVMASDAVIEDTMVRATQPQQKDGFGGHGITVQLVCFEGVCHPTTRAVATLRRTRVEQSHGFGVLVLGSDAIIEDSVVKDTVADLDGNFGDGLAVALAVAPASATITSSTIENSARAGIASFAASVAVGSTAIRCAALPLDGEPLGMNDYVIDDLGDNRCGCREGDGECQVVSSGIEAPTPR